MDDTHSQAHHFIEAVIRKQVFTRRRIFFFSQKHHTMYEGRYGLTLYFSQAYYYWHLNSKGLKSSPGMCKLFPFVFYQKFVRAKKVKFNNKFGHVHKMHIFIAEQCTVGITWQNRILLKNLYVYLLIDHIGCIQFTILELYVPKIYLRFTRFTKWTT